MKYGTNGAAGIICIVHYASLFCKRSLSSPQQYDRTRNKYRRIGPDDYPHGDGKGEIMHYLSAEEKEGKRCEENGCGGNKSP